MKPREIQKSGADYLIGLDAEPGGRFITEWDGLERALPRATVRVKDEGVAKKIMEGDEEALATVIPPVEDAPEPRTYRALGGISLDEKDGQVSIYLNPQQTFRELL